MTSTPNESERIEEQTAEREADTAVREAETVERDEGTCPECGGRLTFDAEHAETACESCGLVVAANEIDRGPEWRAFDSEEERAKRRVGAPTTLLLHDRGLSTKIDWQDRDIRGQVLPPRQRERMQRLRTWNERFRTRDSRERNLMQALGEIDRMASALGLPEGVRETASVIYRRALEEGLLPGRSIEGVATASLYAAARMVGVPRSLDEMLAVSRIDELELTRTYRYVVRELDLEVRLADPASFVGRFASELDLPDETEHRARELLEAAEQRSVFTGRNPVGLAAAAIYAASQLTNQPRTQAQVSEVTDISEVTIRNRYKELLEAAEEAPAS